MNYTGLNATNVAMNKGRTKIGGKMTEDRKVAVEKVSYENSPLFCNLKLSKDMNPEDMKKNKASGSFHIVGLTRGEAEKTYKLLGEVLKHD